MKIKKMIYKINIIFPIYFIYFRLFSSFMFLDMKIWLYFLQHIMLFFIRNNYLTTEKINYNIMNS